MPPAPHQVEQPGFLLTGQAADFRPDCLAKVRQREVFAGVDRPLLLVGETPGVSPEDAIRFSDPSRGELDMVFQFEHMFLDYGAGKWDQRPLDLVALKRTLGRWQEGLAERGWNSLYWDNHDQPRIVSRWGDDGEHRVRSAKLLATILHLQRGTPYIYQGEELGMTNSVFSSIDDFRDLESLNHYKEATAHGEDPAAVLAGLRPMSRDNARTPMQWDGTANAGFTSGTPWIAVTPNYPQINAASQVGDPDSIYSHYRELIALRHDNPVVPDGDFTMLVPDHAQLFAFTRRLDGDELLVVGNWSGAEAVLDGVAVPAGAELILTNAGEAGETLRPWECRVYRSVRSS